MTKKKVYYISIGLVLVIAFGILIWGVNQEKKKPASTYQDGIEMIDPNTIRLNGGKTEVHFSDVLLSSQEEQRKLIISEQRASVSITLTDKIFAAIDFDWLKKSQEISYTANGYFVVDLSKLNAEDIVQDSENKILTIRIEHPYLETVDIDPNKVNIKDVKEGFLNRGDIKMTLSDWNVIEVQLRDRFTKEFDTVSNGQKADDIALRMVKEIYEPIVLAIDDDYQVFVEYK